MGFIKNLQERWKVDSSWKVFVILCVFALTGTTVVYLKGIIKPYVGDFWWFDLVYYIAILPVYNLVLLVYGFLFGQGRYFLDFERRFFARIFKSNKKD